MANETRRSDETSPLYIPKEIAEARDRLQSRDIDSWEIDHRRVILDKKVGSGAFGYVYTANVDIEGHPVVAVKKLKDCPSEDETNEFLREIAMLKEVGYHPNVVELVGCCTIEKPYYAILEYAPNGDLLNYLRSLRDVFKTHRNSFLGVPRPSQGDAEHKICLGDKAMASPAVRPSESGTEYTFLGSDYGSSLKYISGSVVGTMFGPAASATQASFSSATDMEMTYPMTDRTDCSSNGSAFMDSIPPVKGNEYCQAPSVGQALDPKVFHTYSLQIARGMEHLEKKKITHRDLAARNVLIDKNGNLKVSDLGLSRSGIYVPSSRHQKVPLRWLSIEAIELSMYSSKSDVWAYAVLLWEIGTLGAFPYPGVHDHQIPAYLGSGKRLDQPKTISDDIYRTMKHCWSAESSLRPSFSDLVRLLERDETKSKAYIDILTLKEFTFLPIDDFDTGNEFI